MSPAQGSTTPTRHQREQFQVKLLYLITVLWWCCGWETTSSEHEVYTYNHTEYITEVQWHLAAKAPQRAAGTSGGTVSPALYKRADEPRVARAPDVVDCSTAPPPSRSELFVQRHAANADCESAELHATPKSADRVDESLAAQAPDNAEHAAAPPLSQRADEPAHPHVNSPTPSPRIKSAALSAASSAGTAEGAATEFRALPSAEIDFVSSLPLRSTPKCRAIKASSAAHIPPAQSADLAVFTAGRAARIATSFVAHRLPATVPSPFAPAPALDAALALGPTSSPPLIPAPAHPHTWRGESALDAESRPRSAPLPSPPRVPSTAPRAVPSAAPSAATLAGFSGALLPGGRADSNSSYPLRCTPACCAIKVSSASNTVVRRSANPAVLTAGLAERTTVLDAAHRMPAAVSAPFAQEISLNAASALGSASSPPLIPAPARPHTASAAHVPVIPIAVHAGTSSAPPLSKGIVPVAPHLPRCAPACRVEDASLADTHRVASESSYASFHVSECAVDHLSCRPSATAPQRRNALTPISACSATPAVARAALPTSMPSSAAWSAPSLAASSALSSAPSSAASSAHSFAALSAPSCAASSATGRLALTRALDLNGVCLASPAITHAALTARLAPICASSPNGVCPAAPPSKSLTTGLAPVSACTAATAFVALTSLALSRAIFAWFGVLIHDELLEGVCPAASAFTHAAPTARLALIRAPIPKGVCPAALAFKSLTTGLALVSACSAATAFVALTSLAIIPAHGPTRTSCASLASATPMAVCVSALNAIPPGEGIVSGPPRPPRCAPACRVVDDASPARAPSAALELPCTNLHDSESAVNHPSCYPSVVAPPRRGPPASNSACPVACALTGAALSTRLTLICAPAPNGVCPAAPTLTHAALTANFALICASAPNGVCSAAPALICAALTMGLALISAGSAVLAFTCAALTALALNRAAIIALAVAPIHDTPLPAPDAFADATSRARHGHQCERDPGPADG
eukprot:gene1997-biopygen6457